jgi:hypothetical protein
LVQKILLEEELLIGLRRKINFDREQKVAAIDQETYRDVLIDCDRLFGHL